MSKQARSRRTTELLLTSAEEVAGEVGFERLTLAEVARRAGCTTGAVYGRFANKAALLDALHERHVERGMGRLLEHLGQVPTHMDRAEVLSGLVGLFVDEYERHWPIISAFGSMLTSNQDFAARHLRLVRALTEQSGQALRAEEREVFMCVTVVMGSLDRALLLRRLAPDLPVPDRDSLVGDLTRVCLALLTDG